MDQPMPMPVMAVVFVNFPDGTQGVVVSKHYNDYTPYETVQTTLPMDVWLDSMEGFNQLWGTMTKLAEQEADE